jgi:hypothetical protein
MDPVGCNDEFIGACRTIREDDVDLTILLTQRCHSGAESQWDTGGAIEEYSVEVMPSDAHARTDPLPELCQLDFGQLSSCMIQNPLMRHADSSSQHHVRKTKRAKSANAVAGEVQAGTADRPRRRALDDFRNDALLAQRSGECKTCDAATDDQDA